MKAPTVKGAEIRAPIIGRDSAILTREALAFLADLHRHFNRTRQDLLHRRAERQVRIDRGDMLDFLPETASVREGSWKIGPLPADLHDRKVEITGPTDRKMMINALNSGAQVFMADFEDANTPAWRNVVEGQLNLLDAVRRTLQFTSPEGKEYRLNRETATLLVRPRGWHLPEKHVIIDRVPISGSLVDFGLYFFHNAKELRTRGTGPYFYLPKMESHLEARLWNEVFRFSEGHRPHRDDSGRLRDGGDPVRTPGPRRGPQRGPVGLHLQHHQEVPGSEGVHPARSGPGDDDSTLHAGIYEPAREDVPSSGGPRYRRHGRVHPESQGSRGERDRAGEGAGGQDSGGERRL